MRIVADANALVGELLRRRGLALVADPALELSIAEFAWQEATHVLAKRVAILEQRGRVERGTSDQVVLDTLAYAASYLRRVPSVVYEPREAEARRRIPRDPDDWHTVALALTLDAAIWTHDQDFFGCGVATWTTDTLLAHLQAQTSP